MCVLFFILEQTVNEFDNQMDKKKILFDYYLPYCKFISDRKKPVELYKDGQNRDGKY